MLLSLWSAYFQQSETPVFRRISGGQSRTKRLEPEYQRESSKPVIDAYFIKNRQAEEDALILLLIA